MRFCNGRLLFSFSFVNIPCFLTVFFCWEVFSALTSVCVFVCVLITAVILDLLHSGDDLRAGREVQVEPI